MHVAPPTVPTSSEIEAIVRAVLQRLRSQQLPLPGGSSPLVDRADATSTDPASLRLDQPLVTLEDLRDRWGSLQVLEVPSRCVVTPAVHDELRRHGIRLVRTEPQGGSEDAQAGARLDCRLLLLIPATGKSQLRALLKPADAQVATVAHCNQSALEALRTHLQDQQALAIWSAPRPFAALRACAPLSYVAAVQLSRPEELPQAIDEAQPNLLIVDDRRWTASGVAHLAKAWLRITRNIPAPPRSHK